MTGAVKLNTAGGGSVLVQPASSIASDVTVNVPSQNCTLGIQGPAFSAYGNAQSVANATWTKINFENEEFDTNNNFSSSRFTPTIAGYYQLTSAIYYGTTTNGCNLSIYKNGIEFKRGPTAAGISGVGTNAGVAPIVYMNGSTDYVECYMYQNSGGSITTNGNALLQYFQGALVRAA